jgi:hypothetical protein
MAVTVIGSATGNFYSVYNNTVVTTYVRTGAQTILRFETERQALAYAKSHGKVTKGIIPGRF